MKLRKMKRVYANDNDAMIPELWAKYTLAILESNMVAGNLVYRDFESQVANFGDTVNTRKPGTFTVSRKTDTDDVTPQDASTTNVAVTLNMHPYVSFLIRDGEESMAMQSLVDLHLEPAVKAMAEHIDACILGQVYQFLSTAGTGGQLGTLSSSNYAQYLAEVGERLDVTKCPPGGRNIIVSPAVKRLLLQNTLLVAADQRGDMGTALRTASMGMIYGFDHYMCQNMKSIGITDTLHTGAINNAGGYAAGTATMTVDGITGAVTVGSWIKLGGRPYQITAQSAPGGNTTSITVSPVLRAAVANDDAFTVYAGGAVNLVAGYAAGWSKAIMYDGFTAQPKVGQALTFGTTTPIYTIVSVSATEILLDRPLEAGIANDAVINLLPPGDYGFAFVQPAVALVCRPLKLPRAGAGAIAGSVNHNGFSLRVVIAYRPEKQGHQVTIDCLMGVKVLDTSYGAVLLG